MVGPVELESCRSGEEILADLQTLTRPTHGGRRKPSTRVVASTDAAHRIVVVLDGGWNLLAVFHGDVRTVDTGSVIHGRVAYASATVFLGSALLLGAALSAALFVHDPGFRDGRWVLPLFSAGTFVFVPLMAWKTRRAAFTLRERLAAFAAGRGDRASDGRFVGAHGYRNRANPGRNAGTSTSPNRT